MPSCSRCPAGSFVLIPVSWGCDTLVAWRYDPATRASQLHFRAKTKGHALSAYHKPFALPPLFVPDVLSHLFFVGLTIALIVRRYSK